MLKLQGMGRNMGENQELKKNAAGNLLPLVDRRFAGLSARELTAQVVLYLIGIVWIPFGVVLTINAHVGAGGYDALNFALADLLSVKTSHAIYMTAMLAVLIAAFFRRSYPRFLTFVTSFLMGITTDFWKIMLSDVQAQGWLSGFAMMALGMLIVAFSIACYVTSYFPANPTDDLMSAIEESGVRLGVAKISMDLVCVILAFLLHGEIGVGTIAITIGLGPLIDGFSKITEKVYQQCT